MRVLLCCLMAMMCCNAGAMKKDVKQLKPVTVAHTTHRYHHGIEECNGLLALSDPEIGFVKILDVSDAKKPSVVRKKHYPFEYFVEIEGKPFVLAFNNRAKFEFFSKGGSRDCWCHFLLHKYVPEKEEKFQQIQSLDIRNFGLKDDDSNWHCSLQFNTKGQCVALNHGVVTHFNVGVKRTKFLVQQKKYELPKKNLMNRLLHFGDGGYLVTAEAKNWHSPCVLRVMNVYDGKECLSLESPVDLADVARVGLFGEKKIVFLRKKNSLEVISIQGGTIHVIKPSKIDKICSMDMSHDETLLYIGTNKGTIHVIDIQTKKTVNILHVNEDIDEEQEIIINAVKVTKDGKRVFANYWNPSKERGNRYSKTVVWEL